MSNIRAAKSAWDALDNPDEMDLCNWALDWGEKALYEGASAIYQIRRAAAQLEIVETSPKNVYQIRDVASSVLAQLRAYLEKVDNEETTS